MKTEEELANPGSDGKWTLNEGNMAKKCTNKTLINNRHFANVIQ